MPPPPSLFGHYCQNSKIVNYYEEVFLFFWISSFRWINPPFPSKKIACLGVATKITLLQNKRSWWFFVHQKAIDITVMNFFLLCFPIFSTDWEKWRNQIDLLTINQRIVDGLMILILVLVILFVYGTLI